MNAFQKVGEFMNQERRRALAVDQDLIEGDGTKCHGLIGKKNKVNVILGKNMENSERNRF
jgi:hypothetical protein